jgi:hypothetical protein
MRTPNPDRTRYLKPPRQFVEDDCGPDDEDREDPINGVGETQESK